jgi:hypothetical protein
VSHSKKEGFKLKTNWIGEREFKNYFFSSNTVWRLEALKGYATSWHARGADCLDTGDLLTMRVENFKV